MKKLVLAVALVTVMGFSSQANAGVYVNVGLGGGYCGRGYPAYGYAPGYSYGPSYYGYGSRYYYGYGPRYYHYGHHRHFRY
jgi:hypothetical protein